VAAAKITALPQGRLLHRVKVASSNRTRRSSVASHHRNRIRRLRKAVPSMSLRENPPRDLSLSSRTLMQEHPTTLPNRKRTTRCGRRVLRAAAVADATSSNSLQRSALICKRPANRRPFFIPIVASSAL
jgi:hypothetical protein